MPGLDVDTSSYPKPAAPKDMVDTIKGWGGLHQQQQQIESTDLTISKQKLDQINTQFGLMNQELSGLADPEGNNGKPFTKEQAIQRLTTFANTYGFKPEVTNHMLNELKEAPNVPTFARKSLIRGQREEEKVNRLYAVPGLMNNGQTVTPIATSPMLNGGAPRATGLPIQQQIPPGTPTVDENNTPRLQGPTPAIAPPGTVTGPGQLPIRQVPTQSIRPQQQNTLPVAPRSDTGVTPQGTPVSQVMADRYPAPAGPAVGMSPLFEEGKKLYTQDQSEASARMMAAKPAIQALPLMQTKGFLSGPLTSEFTKAAAALKGWGIVNTAKENDPTAVRQEVVKKLAQYLSSSPVGQRSDAAQALKEAGSPNPSVQILPALVKLTKDAVALDRVQAAMPLSFKDKNFEKYVSHRGTFPQSMDEKAFTLDLEPEEKSKELVDKMAKQLQSTNKREVAQADKFFKSLRIAKDHGFYQ